MQYFNNANNSKIIVDICDEIIANAQYLSEIDGATGDGDHGINMAKGFSLAKDRIRNEMSFSEALKVLSNTLVLDIGGSMGPIYGTMFNRLSKSFQEEVRIDKIKFLEGLENANNALMLLAGAKPGDKTLIDTLNPAILSMKDLINEYDFEDCLAALQKGAEEGKENTKNLVAKIGRAARLGERSKGFLDAGATSCWIIINKMAEGIKKVIINE